MLHSPFRFPPFYAHLSVTAAGLLKGPNLRRVEVHRENAGNIFVYPGGSQDN